MAGRSTADHRAVAAVKWRIIKDDGTWYVYHPSGYPWARFPEWARAIRFVEQWARS